MKKLTQLLSVVIGLALLAVAGIGLAGILQSATSGRAPAAAQTPQGYPAPLLAPYNTPVGYPAPPTAPAISPTPYPTEQPTSVLPPLLDSPEQFDPKTYGIPETIAGYKVLAVITSANTACWAPAPKQLVLQSTASSADAFLNSGQATDVEKAMKDLGLNPSEWSMSFGGPGSTREQVISGTQEWNRLMEKGGCVHSGPAGPTSVPVLP